MARPGDTQARGENAIEGHPIFAAAYDRFGGVGEGFLRDHRQYLARDLEGSVLDLGAGTGDMFPYFARAAAAEVESEGANASEDGTAQGLAFHGIEPDPHMKRRAKRAASEGPLDIDLRLARAESLPYPDDSIDVTVASLVFCTISDPEHAFAEVSCVLRPGGELRFLEHVRSDGLLGHAQDVLAPAWKIVGAGCHLNRDFEGLLARSPLETIDVETIRAPPPATPILRGRARKRP
jgi:ubiquinone/menaquinone biosynthesis C-methylase UbiE